MPQLFKRKYWLPIFHQTKLHEFSTQIIKCKRFLTHLKNNQYIQIPPVNNHIYAKNNLDDRPRGALNTSRPRRHNSMSIATPNKDIGFGNYKVSYMFGSTSNYEVNAGECFEYENEYLNGVFSNREFENIPVSQHSADFTNPSKDNPVRVQDILKCLDLSEIIPIVEDFYIEPTHFRFSPEAVLRTIIYWKLKGYKFLSQVFNDLLTDPTLADTLGFGAIPDYNQLYHFFNYRLDRIKVKKLFDAFLKSILKESESLGVPIGFEVMTDSCPLQAKPKDQDATYNGHYKMFGYKLHSIRCALTGVPLDFHVSTITEYDGYILPPLLLRLRMNKIEPSKIYMDGAYATFENISRLKLFWNDIEIKCNIAKDWKIHRDANESQIFKVYNQLWNIPLFVPKPDFEYQQLLLLMTNDDENTAKHDLVGQYYRNQIMKEFYINPKEYLDDYHIRNRIESRHGSEKLLSNIGNINGKGIEKFTIHVGMHLVSTMALALCRLQNGVTKGLVNLGGLI